MHRSLIGALLAATALAVAGCGDEEATSTATGSGGESGEVVGESGSTTGTTSDGEPSASDTTGGALEDERSVPEATPPASEDDPSVPEYIARADQICGDIEDGLTGDEAVDAELVNSGFEAFKALPPPPELEAQVDDYVDAVEDQLRFAAQGDSAGAERALGRTQRIASGIGFEECGSV